MENWYICEKECLEFFKKNYSSEDFVFEAEGGADSTKSDILLLNNGIPVFYIESKMKQAQCGQFVVYQQDDRFVNSTRNRHNSSFSEDMIIDKMNEDFAYYANPGTSGKELKLEKSYYYDWILNYYDDKKVKYFIVEKVVGKNILTSDNFIIFPIQHFHKYFDVSAKYRVKKSGSNSPSKNSLIEIEDTLKRNNLHYSNLHFNSTKLFVQIPARSEKFQMNGINYDYQFNPQNDGYFEIRRLSNTKNANVIFSISLMKAQEQRDLDKFNAEFN